MIQVYSVLSLGAWYVQASSMRGAGLFHACVYHAKYRHKYSYLVVSATCVLAVLAIVLHTLIRHVLLHGQVCLFITTVIGNRQGLYMYSSIMCCKISLSYITRCRSLRDLHIEGWRPEAV
jgi:hypothetical protein